jgi:hypothetical protein
MLRGADASTLQSWTGFQFGFARCQQQYGQADPAFVANVQRMHDQGVIAGGYEFALPMTSGGVPLTSLPDPADRARTSWNYFTKAALLPTDLFVLDLEISPLGQDETNAWAKAWFDEWERVADRPPGLYLASGYLVNRTGLGLREHGFAWLWYPRPDSVGWTGSPWPATFSPRLPSGATSWADTTWGQLPDFWQFAFGSSYDGDVFNGTLAELQSLNQVDDVLIGLTLGSTGNAVRELQTLLTMAGFAPGSVNGVYDASTAAAVLACRKARGSAATSGNTIDFNAYSQIMTSMVLARSATIKGDKGDTGQVGPAGADGAPGADSTIPGPQGEPGLTPTKITLSLTGDVVEVE